MNSTRYPKREIEPLFCLLATSLHSNISTTPLTRTLSFSAIFLYTKIHSNVHGLRCKRGQVISTGKINKLLPHAFKCTKFDDIEIP